VGRDAEDVDAPRGLLDHREDISGGAVEQVRGEEVRGQEGFCLGAQELAPEGCQNPARAAELVFRPLGSVDYSA